MSTTIPQQSRHGPFGSEREAHQAALTIGGPPRPGWSILSAEQSARMLTGACQAAGVDLGAFDERILTWLAGFEDSTCAVVAGLVTRARAAGALDPAEPTGHVPPEVGGLRCCYCHRSDCALRPHPDQPGQVVCIDFDRCLKDMRARLQAIADEAGS